MTDPRDRAAPNRFQPPALSSRARRLFMPGLLLLSTAALAAVVAQDEPTRPAPAPPGFAGWNETALRQAIADWRRLRGNDSLPFQSYASFLTAHPGWPGDTAMRRAAERRIDPNNYTPGDVVTFFTRTPPLTAAGQARYAEALAATGRSGEARTAAAAAWGMKGLSADDEGRLLTRFGGQFSASDHDRRMERLLWDRNATAASRFLTLATPARRPLYEARIALIRNDPDAATRVVAAGEAANRDPGFLLDRARWMRDRGNGFDARVWLAQSRTLSGVPYDAAIWLDTLFQFGRQAAADNQNDLAFAIARHAEETYPSGTQVRDRPFDERDDYTNLMWLGGTVALKRIGRPADAMTMFDRYARAAQSPSTQTKGMYWAGRAAEQANKSDWANSYFGQAASHIDQFYGQLAAERLGRQLTMPADSNRAVAPTERAAFEASEVVRATRLLGRDGQWQDQTAFIRLIASDAKTDIDHALAGELARSIGRPDLGVMVSRAARTSGTPDPLRIGFPTVAVPPAMADHWTMVHAISRQESQFDRQATSRTGARGLMQLMPATAKEQAGKVGLPYDPARLAEVDYNVMLGSSFFDRMLNYYNGSYVLAIASYNAGPGNVNKFIRANGDPRMPGVDVVDWIEAIPFEETRGYVQRVLENAVVYDLMNPSRARTPTKNRLSTYLAKKTPG
ncbi:transglycosylase SLT domain-containing protein [Sphingomonas montanisoli]|uniref:Transglycosylase SLT domain-containing protein n=2 Tax=Sphingomonas montanisoli TaxID=2606412 RepID=A0A5D9C9N0_9SPHN|nr:transglycosylase SLT domain-containing protein [Sphingomonas montanisoli]